MAIIGYIRVSTDTQDMALQRDALESIGCDKIFEEVISGAKKERPQLEKCFDYLREGDTLTVWRLDRLGRSLKDLIEIVNRLHEQGIAFKSITEHIDTTSAGGKLVFHIFGAMAEFERNIISERTTAGLEAARKRGRVGGRKRKLSDTQITLMKEMYNSKKHSLSEIGKAFGVSKGTVYTWVKR